MTHEVEQAGLNEIIGQENTINSQGEEREGTSSEKRTVADDSMGSGKVYKINGT